MWTRLTISSTEDLALRLSVSFFAASCFFVTPGGQAQEPVTAAAVQSRMIGQVVDADRSRRPLAGVTVRLEGSSRSDTVTTSRDGSFEFETLPPGEYAVEATHVGYETVRQSLWVDGSGRTHFVELRLGRRAIPLEPIVVSVAPRRMPGALGPVYDRVEAVRLWGFGTVIDRDDIERRKATRTTHLLEGVKGLRMQHVPTGRMGVGQTAIVSTRAMSHLGACRMAVWLDGHRIIDAKTAFEGDINRIISPGHIEVIEIYHPADRIPEQYWGSHAGCGVVLIWTRRAP